MAEKRIRKRRVAIVILLGLLAYEAYTYVFPTYHVRYALTIEVLASGKLYKNTSVVDATIEKASYFRVMGGPIFHHLDSHCPSIDLGDDGIMFMPNSDSLFPGRDPRWSKEGTYANLIFLPFYVYSLRPSGSNYVIASLQHEGVSGKLEGEVDVPLDFLPLVARFRDLEDPTSMEELNPRDLSPAYGPGSRVVRATLKMTDDPTTAIPSYWPAWLRNSPPPSMPIAVPEKDPDGQTIYGKHYLYIQQIKGGY